MGNAVRDRSSDLSEQEIEALKITQGIIKRMADNSQKLKTWYLSLCALCAVLAGQELFSRASFLVFVAVSIVFWHMDAKYLHLERKFRQHYQAIIDSSIPNLDKFACRVTAYSVESLPAIMMKNFSVRIYPVFIFIVSALFIVG